MYDQDKGQYEQISANFNLKLVNRFIIMDMTLTQALQGHNYKAQWKQPTRVQFKVDQTVFELQAFNYSFIYVSSSSTQDEVLGAKAQGDTIGAMVAIVPVRSATVQEMVFTAAAVDPTGIATRFAQITRIIGRMYYFNVYFRDRLSEFLRSVEKNSQTRYSKDSSQLVRKSVGFRGKLTTRKVLADFGTLHWKLILYTIGWILKGVSILFRHLEVKVGRIGLNLLFYVPKIQLVLLNMVLIDFAFHGTHSALHFSLQPSVTFAYIFLSMFVADLLSMLTWVFCDSAWHLGIQRLTRGLPKSKETTKTQEIQFEGNNIVENDVKNDISINGLDIQDKSSGQMFGDSTLKDTPNQQPMKKTIDYPTSYRYITSGMHHVALLSGSLRLDAKVFESRLSRSLFVLHSTRVFAYQSLIAASQQITWLVASTLLLVELSKLALVVYLQMKVKPFKNIFFMAAELS